jgi:hypothetical protein
MAGRIARRLVWVAALASVLVPAARPSTSPTALLRSILVSAEAENAVRYVSVQSAGTDRISEVTDAAWDQGIQRITYTHAGQTGHVTVLLKSGTAYVNGDTFALTSYMGYDPDASATYSGRWIEIPSGDHDYNAVSTDVTMPEAVQLYVPTPLWLSSSGDVQGRPAIGVSGAKTATATSPAMTVTLFAQAAGPPLPVEQDIVKGAYTATVTFSRWNEKVRIAAPPSPTPIATTGLEVAAAPGCGCSP